MKYLEATVDLPPSLRHPMDAFLRGTDAIRREELVTWNIEADGTEYALFFVDGDLDAYRGRIDDVASIREYNLTPVSDGSFYAYVVEDGDAVDRSWRAAFRERNLVIVPPIVFDDAGMTLTVVGAGPDLRGLVSDLPDALDVAVHEIGDYDRRHGTIAAGLTDRQLEALEAAVSVGYYEIPREAGVEAVAEELGCAPSTASTHLRKAESAVVTRLVDP